MDADTTPCRRICVRASPERGGVGGGLKGSELSSVSSVPIPAPSKGMRASSRRLRCPAFGVPIGLVIGDDVCWNSIHLPAGKVGRGGLLTVSGSLAVALDDTLVTCIMHVFDDQASRIWQHKNVRCEIWRSPTVSVGKQIV